MTTQTIHSPVSLVNDLNNIPVGTNEYSSVHHTFEGDTLVVWFVRSLTTESVAALVDPQGEGIRYVEAGGVHYTVQGLLYGTECRGDLSEAQEALLASYEDATGTGIIARVVPLVRDEVLAPLIIRESYWVA